MASDASEQSRGRGRPQTPLGQMQEGGAKRARIAAALGKVQELDGGDGTDLISELAKKKRIEMPSMMLTKLRKVVSLIRDAYSKSSPHNKRQMLSLVAGIFTRQELKEFGFTCSESAYRCACEHVDKTYAGAPVPEKVAPRTLNLEQKQQVLEMLHENAPRPAPDRMVYNINAETGERELCSVMYLEKSRSDIYTLYKRKYEDDAVSYASFNRICNVYAKDVKNPRRWTGRNAYHSSIIIFF